MENFKHFYEQITIKTLHMRLNDYDISHHLARSTRL
jgi:hypothetical protein